MTYQTKKCCRCGLEKPESDFTKDKSQKDGLRLSCKACKAIYSKQYTKNVPDSVREYRAQWQRDNKEKRHASSAKWTAANPEKVKAARVERRDAFNEYRKKWRAEKKKAGLDVDAAWKLKNKEKLKEYKAKHEAKYPHKPIEMNAKRRATKKRAMPAWTNRKYVALFYAMARHDSIVTGTKMVVDHIVPLQSKFVCGLHCEDNLQILTVSANAKKLNTYWPNMWEKLGE